MLVTGDLIHRQNTRALARMLDENHPPVARFRLISTGISPNHCLSEAGDITGQTACMACGNCLDACPVVLQKAGAVTLQTQRTSLYLETLVDNSCIRCYSCIRACPQVDRPLKDFAARHRMVEKVLHWWVVAVYITLAATGIGLNHFRAEWSDSFVWLVGMIHRIAAVMFVVSPFVFWRFDPGHFKRTMAAISKWGRQDWRWVGDAFSLVFRRRRDIQLFQGEYSTGQKVWYWVVLGGMAVLTVTGIIKWNAAGPATNELVSTGTWIHAGTALVMDLLLLLHIYRKLVGRAIRRAMVMRQSALKVSENQELGLANEELPGNHILKKFLPRAKEGLG